MSWFDDLFSNNDNSDDELLRRKSKRRHDSKTQMNNDDTLLPENNDIYDRPKGKFRFPIEVGRDNEDYEEAIYHEDDEYLHSSNYNNDNDQNVNHFEDNQFIYDSAQDTRKRRRRHHTNIDDTGIPSIKSRSSQPQTSTSRNNVSKRTNGNSYKMNADTNYNPDNHQSRYKLQSERFKSSYKLSSDSTYHRPSFKTSEVPSAIFGTKKRRPIKNGVIPPADDSIDESSDILSKSSDKTAEQSTYSNSANVQSAEKNNDTELNHGKSSYVSEDSESLNQSSNGDKEKEERIPNYSQRDNTVNIENIYASQIVEEIRRERERKAQQKRKFKKALQNKRQQADEDQDGIQKAIDEMYAKQAEQYIGESSLNEDEVLFNNEVQNHSNDANRYGVDNTFEPKNESNVIDENIQTNGSNDEDAHIQNESIQENSSDSYNYEEIDLNQVSKVQQVDQDDVQVKDISQEDAYQESLDNDIDVGNESTTNSSENLNDHHNIGHQNDSTHNDMNNTETDANFEDINEVTSVNSKVSNDITFDNNSHEASDNDIDEAYYREIDSDSTSDVHANTSNNDIEQEHSSNSNNQHIDYLGNAVESDVEYAPKHSVDNDSNTPNNDNLSNEPKLDVDNRELSNEDNNDDKHSSTENDAHIDINEKEKHVDHSESLQKDTTAKVQQRSIKPGSKPFNVVMTPSDKKRMMDAKKNNQVRSKVNVPELKPETKNVQTSINNNEDQNTNVNKQMKDDQSSQSDFIVDDNISLNNENFKTEDKANSDNLDANDISNLNTSSSSKEGLDQHELEPTNQHETHEHLQQDNQRHPDNQSNIQKPAIRKGPNIKLPSIDLLEDPEEQEIDESWIEEKKQELNDAFYYFNVPAEVQKVTKGPSVTRFELAVEKGVKVSRITALQDDIKMALAAKDIRIEAPIPGTSLVGIEVPNLNPTKVNLKSIIDSQKFKNTESKLTVAMGNRINNEPLLMDIAKTPHALIAGATGSGKSVCINSILMSLLYKNHPEELRLLLIDPKMVELAPYNDLPHLVSPVITDVKAATQSLKWAVEEMERRYKLFAKFHVRNITAFNKKAPYEQRMPKIVIVIDELADLMMMAPQEVEQSIARIAQKARACGIHMLVATQRPSVNVITGLIKANIPTRIAFMVSSSVDSRTILDSGGAERLLGYGDMLYLGSGMNKPIRVQGTFVSDEEIDDVVDFIKEQREPDYLFEEKELLKKNQTQAQDELFDDVCEFMVREGHISTSLIQRHFQIGYNRAARIVDQLEQLNYISGANGSKPRDVFITESDLKKD
ncbi:DNA translocase FtsK [Staphylococcus taiwanensis]|nr:DNA translocase FtsK [Staphylococcus taiwanensis]